MVYPKAEESNTIYNAHDQCVQPFFSAFDHSTDILGKCIAEEEKTIKNHVAEGNEERFFCRPADYVVAKAEFIAEEILTESYDQVSDTNGAARKQNGFPYIFQVQFHIPGRWRHQFRTIGHKVTKEEETR